MSRTDFQGGLSMPPLQLLAILSLALLFTATVGKSASNDRLSPVVIFGEDKYQFPRNARDFMPDETGVVRKMSLRVVYPEMEGRTHANWRSMSMPTQSNKSIQLLLSDDGLPGEHILVTPQQSLNLRVWYGLTRKPRTSHYFKEVSFEVILEDFHRVSAYGLDELVLKPEIRVEPLDYLRRGMQRGERHFIKTTGNDAKIFISCRSRETVKNPGCNMWFTFKDIFVKANFRLALLPEWNGIQTKLLDYFEEYRVK
jgi:hypothetical protein